MDIYIGKYDRHYEYATSIKFCCVSMSRQLTHPHSLIHLHNMDGGEMTIRITKDGYPGWAAFDTITHCPYCGAKIQFLREEK